MVEIVGEIGVNHNGNMAMAKPCANCMNLIYKYKIDTIYFTNVCGEWEILKISYK